MGISDDIFWNVVCDCINALLGGIWVYKMTSARFQGKCFQCNAFYNVLPQ